MGGKAQNMMIQWLF